MHRLFYIMGKSASGKDSLYGKLLGVLPLKPYVPYTTRPMRENEQNGREYYFMTADELAMLRQTGHVVEERCYHTVQGDWYYFSADSHIDLNTYDYLGIGTLESYEKIRAFFGAAHVVPLYIEVDDHTRLLRAIAREAAQEKPDYAELCRRFLADTSDFSEDHLAQAGISRRFCNDDLERCLNELCGYIQEERG